MTRIVYAALLAAIVAPPAQSQEAVGSLTMTLGGEERQFVLIQGGEGANPGSRFSRIGEDVVMTVVGVLGDEPREPDDAEATIELRFTVDTEGHEVRTGSVLSYSTRDAEGKPSTRGGTVEIDLETLDVAEDIVAVSGTFSAALPPDAMSDGTDANGTFRTAMKPREALNP